MSDEQYELEVPNVSEEIQQKLEDLTGDKKIRLLRFMAEQTAEYLRSVQDQVKDVENFWPFSLLAHIVIKQACSLKADRQALQYLTNVELIQDPKDPRPYEIVFHFKENPYFSNSTLSKKYTLPSGVQAAPTDGSITKEMREFDIDDLESSPITIDWKDDLCKKFPRKLFDGTQDYDGDQGSFFHYFTEAADPFQVSPQIPTYPIQSAANAQLGAILQQDILPDVFDYFRGVGENCDAGDDFDEDDELDEEDDEDEDEIDLEEDPRNKKKQKTQ